MKSRTVMSRFDFQVFAYGSCVPISRASLEMALEHTAIEKQSETESTIGIDIQLRQRDWGTKRIDLA
jgi:hypothetical protein